MVRKVLNHHILISATLWDDSAAQKFLFKCISKNIQIFSSKEIIEEYKGILARDFNYNQQEIENILEKILQIITLANPRNKVNVVKEDPDDNKIIECAIESEAEHIVSYDKHLLKLKEYNGIKIFKPEDF